MKAGNQNKRRAPGFIPPIDLLQFDFSGPKRFPPQCSLERNEYIVPFPSFYIIKQPQPALSLLNEKRCGDLSLSSLQYQKNIANKVKPGLQVVRTVDTSPGVCVFLSHLQE